MDVMGEKDAQLLRTYWMALLTAILLIGGGYFGYTFFTQEEKTLANDLTPLGYLGERIESDLNSEPLLEVSEELSIEDTLRDGIQIEYPNQISNLKNQNDNEENQNETTFTTDDGEETLSLNFPKDLSEPMEITLPGGSFTVTHDTNQDYSVDLLTREQVDQELPRSDLEEEQRDGKRSDLGNSYVRYTSEDERKQIYYAYQKDQADGYRNLKHWTLYNHGIGIESESYTFTNVTLKINDRGEVEGRFLTPFGNEQDSINNTQGVDDDLWARAQRVIAQDMELSTPPDFIIPPPYYLDQYGRQTTLEWALNNNKDTISVAFNPLPGEYPVALDPTLQFTAPGVSNSGDYIDGESVGYRFGQAIATGDFNGDGRADLVVGAHDYGSNVGRTFIFTGVSEDRLTGNAEDADVIITGESPARDFGYAFAVGDWNNDGRDDLAVGAPNTDYIGPGVVYIYYSITLKGILSASSSADVIIHGSDSSGLFGEQMTVGDWNNDGIDDIAVGARYYGADDGRVHIFYGGTLGVSLAVDNDEDVLITGTGTFPQFGSALATGDWNNDGGDDIIIGSRYHNSGTGRAYIFYGGSFAATLAAGVDEDVLIVGGASYDHFGSGVVVGDLNHDGRDDVVIAAEEYAGAQYGRLYVVYGGTSSTTINASESNVIITGSNSDDYLGRSMAVGDVNGDGIDDLIAGAYRGLTEAGNGYVFYGGALNAVVDADGDSDVHVVGESGSVFGSGATISDMNGDGKNDVLFGAQRYGALIGRTYIFYSQSGQVNLNDHITGEGTSDYFGSAFAVGDFNSDGRDDLAVGAYVDATNRGKVYVFYNDGAYPTGAGSADVVLTGAASGDKFGYALYAADLNSDGTDDLVVNAREYGGNEGRVYIFNGGAMISEGAAGADITITGEGVDNRFGESFAVGDYNDDGLTDLVIGAPNYNSFRGRTYVFYGGSIITENASGADVINTGASLNYGYGSGLATGDFNSDGIDDLVVGSKGYSSYSGAVYIFHGGASFDSAADTTISAEATGDGLGYALAVGDYNTDGKDDLAIGALYYPSLGYTGKVYIVYGDGTLASGAVSTLASETIVGEEYGGYFGSVVAVGDYNHDGKDDLVVGARNYTTNTGRAYIFYNDGSYSQYASTSDITITGDSANDDFGYALATGDFNADGKDDLVIGAPGYDNGGDTGRIYFYETREDYAWDIQRQDLSDGVRVDPLMGYEMKITGETTSNSFGRASILADVNNDGTEDIVATAPYYNSSQGKVYMFYNTGNFPAKAGRANKMIVGDASSLFGSAVLSGDFNNDGLTDIVVGAPGHTSYTGKVYVFYGDDEFPTAAGSADIVLTGENVDDEFGGELLSGDWNNDGIDDIAVTAEGYLNPNGGKSYIFYGGELTTESAANADVIFTGNAGSYTSKYLTVGDYNGDGKDDLVVPAEQASSNKGQLYIFYNATLSGSITSANADITLTGVGSEFLGFRLETGDFNTDGVDDVVAGAYPDTYIFYGGSMITETSAGADARLEGDGAPGSIRVGDYNSDGKDDLALGYTAGSGQVSILYNADLVGTTSATTTDVILQGEATGDNYGWSLSSGDVNNDGTEDLFIGAIAYNSSQGRLYFYTTNDRHMTGEGTDSFFGTSLAIGDWNQDGTNDLAVGAYGWNDDNTGRVYVFYGGSKATTSAYGANVIITGEATQSGFGASLVTGDFNKDGGDDLVVGAMLYSNNTGRVYIFHSLPSASFNATSADVILTGESEWGYFGYDMTGGNWNRDAYDDLAVGAATYSGNTGRAYVFYGSTTISSENATNSDYILSGVGASPFFGESLSSGDFNNDGIDDLAIGSQGYDIPVSNAGQVNIFYGSTTNVSRAATSADVSFTGYLSSGSVGTDVYGADVNGDGIDDVIIGAGSATQLGYVYIFYGGSLASSSVLAADVIFESENAGDKLGTGVGAGDLNADGVADVIMQANDYGSLQGRLYIMYGGSLRTTNVAHANIIIEGELASNHSANESPVLVGDLSGNGVDDLVYGASGYDYGNDQGRVYIIMSEASAEHRSSYKIRGNVKIRGTVKFH